ncbi:MAG: 7-cyano-7-deazaguanine synthase QueC [Paramuribaculum sp.]|nr:7-cyano-7-deazaguanine synthase QueC [Paramuribaculum sp.]MDE6323508.1 7-cyano-7-deazaguanine synthase QueC [Paramuribaculum sp.]MDE6489318.1 7-cyano-7-deazaguanine synthase QueC [Paramuribaculum sp.]
MKEKDCLIVLSGGMDSTTMLYDYADTIAAAVNFNYGANHNRREAECARENCRRLGIELIEIDLEFMGRYFESSLLSGGDAIPEGHYADENMRSTVVPFRNGIMLSVAAGLAESRGLKAVMIANHGGDHAIYPDCRPGFIESMGRAIADGTYEGIELRAPYTNMTKAQIAMRGAAIGVDYSLTYSCYKGGESHCGRCGTCVERREALIAAGLEPDC